MPDPVLASSPPGPQHRPTLPPRWLTTAGAWAWPVLLVGAVAYVLGHVLAGFTVVTIPILVSLLFVALLQRPTVALRRVLPPSIAALIVLVFGVGAIGLVGFFVYARVRDQGPALVDQAQEIVNRAADLINDIPGSSGAADDLQAQAQDWLSSNGSVLVGDALTATTLIGELITGLVLTVFLTFFLLSDGERIWAWLVRLFPTRLRGPVNGAGVRGFGVLSGWITGTAIIALIHSIVIGLLLWLLGTPLVLPLAVLLFIGSFIPVVGAFLFGGFSVLVTLVSVGPGPAAIVLGALLAENLLESHVYQPIIIGRAVKLHSVAILLVLTAGALAAGLAGAIFAVPVAAAVHAAVKYLTGIEDVHGRPLRDEDRSEPVAPPEFGSRRGRPQQGAHPLADDENPPESTGS